MRHAARLFLLTLTVATVAGSVMVPAALEATRLLVAPDDTATNVAWRLRDIPASRYEQAIADALAADDPELAASLREVADERQVPLPAALRAQVTAAQTFSPRRLAREIWSGISGGDTSSEAAFGGALAADLTGIGDVRDLAREGGAYLAGQPYDGVVLTLAAAGLAVTVATVVTVGGAAPARTGMTVLKAAKKAGDLPAPLVAELATVSRRALDDEALRATVDSARRLDASGAASAAAKLLKPAELARLTRAADDVATIGTTTGYRAVRQSVKLAESTADLSKLRGLATRLGTRFRGVLALLGGAVLSLAGILLTLSGWALTLLLWLAAVCLLVGRAMLFVLRRLRRLRWGA